MADKDSEKADPLSDTIQKAEKLLSGVQGTLNFGYFLMLYVVSSIAIYVLTYMFIYEFTDDMFNILFWLTISIFFILGIIWILNTREMKKQIHTWRKSHIKLSMGLKYDLTPKKGDTIEDKIKNLMMRIYDSLPEEYEKNPNKFNYNISTKSGYLINWSFSYPRGTIFTKLLDGPEPTREKELAEMKREVFSITGDKKYVRVIVISQSMFTEDAVLFARKQDAGEEKISFDLILEKQDGYSSIYIGDRD